MHHKYLANTGKYSSIECTIYGFNSWRKIGGRLHFVGMVEWEILDSIPKTLTLTFGLPGNQWWTFFGSQWWNWIFLETNGNIGTFLNKQWYFLEGNDGAGSFLEANHRIRTFWETNENTMTFWTLKPMDILKTSDHTGTFWKSLGLSWKPII